MEKIQTAGDKYVSEELQRLERIGSGAGVTPRRPTTLPFAPTSCARSREHTGPIVYKNPVRTTPQGGACAFFFCLIGFFLFCVCFFFFVVVAAGSCSFVLCACFFPEKKIKSQKMQSWSKNTHTHPNKHT